MSKDEQLKRAIRAFTVDAYTAAGEHAPNGPAEAAWLRLSEALLALPGATGQRVAGLVSEYLEADIERLGNLRRAAEAFFGEDFQSASDSAGQEIT